MYFIDRKKITETLTYMERLLDGYERNEKWNADIIHELALEKLVQNVIESIIDVGNSMIDGFIMRDPGSYEDILDILLDEKVISQEMHAPLVKVIGLRKMLVRDFVKVDTDLVISIMNEGMEALKQFAPAVRAYLENELGAVSAFMPEGQ
ncbi:DUF86 domain-containing protein [Chungangia koreensis]|uniref:DUF86 domain-containing protein n=1 Tax=Chungangia koreensis TaxID=752657 RepID=A0ABV8X7H7_9LACT